MRRDLKLVKHLLDMVQAYADHEGVYLSVLLPKWESSSGDSENPLSYDQLVYHVNLCANAGFISVETGNIIQMTWAGHEYLDAQAVTHQA
ncbi:hypothetical protein [Pseudomonas xanthosomatis]|uniref:hypothetical protein n=1 Tax=Pseudomonas xanthosomatis TaxID=2842356 RepID=UPI0035178F1C